MNSKLLALAFAPLLLAASAVAQIVPAAPAVSTAPAAGAAPPAVSTAPAPGAVTTPDGHPGPGTRLWPQACDADMRRLCPGLTDRRAVYECLDRNVGRLSDGCRRKY